MKPLRRYLYTPKWYHLVVNYEMLRNMGGTPPGYVYCCQIENQSWWTFTPYQFVLTDWIEGKVVALTVKFSQWAFRAGFLDIPEGENVKSLSPYWKWDFWNVCKKRRR